MPFDPVYSKMAILGHPIHPMLIHFPVAALVGLMGTDVAFVLSGDLFWARAGLWLAGVGALGGWISGIVGLLDLVLVARIRRQITGWCHAVLAVMVLSLASLNWLLRFVDTPEAHIIPSGIFLSLLTGGLISLTSYFGGRLVYDYGIGVDIRGAVSKHTTSRTHEPPQG
jgi:uncharacterized membrane protein